MPPATHHAASSPKPGAGSSSARPSDHGRAARIAMAKAVLSDCGASSRTRSAAHMAMIARGGQLRWRALMSDQRPIALVDID